MLTSLTIRNFALIEKLSIDFSEGFSIITGETGAGKSILLGALGLVLGKRADLTSLKNKEEKCVIEANFTISDYQLDFFFESNDLDYDPHTILRREILPSGKSRAFVNDCPINLQQLQELGQLLIDIHSQNQTQELSEESLQFSIIDAIAGNQNLVNEYEKLIKIYKKEKNQLNSLNQQLKEAAKEQDYNSFLLEELQAANFSLGQQEELESLYEQLNNVEFIKMNLDKSLSLSEDDQFGVLCQLKEIKTTLQKIASIVPEYDSLFIRTNSLLIEFDDVVSEMHQCEEQLIDDPEQLNLANEKLQTLYALQKKHQVQTVDELLEIQSEFEIKIVSVGSIDADIKNLESNIDASEKKLDELAQSIRELRLKAIPILSDKLQYILEQLGMPNARFNIDLNPVETYLNNGKDELQFLFSANKKSSFGLLKKIASGGEMSRIMLAVKAILADYSKLPTIIFIGFL